MKYKWTVISVFLASIIYSSPTFAEPASRESVKQLMESTGAAELGVQMMEQMLPILKAMAPKAPDSFWEEVMANVDASELMEMIIPVYQKHLSEEDVQAINAFNDTPAGRKLIIVQPFIMRDSMLAGQQWGKKLTEKVLLRYQGQTQQQTSP